MTKLAIVAIFTFSVIQAVEYGPAAGGAGVPGEHDSACTGCHGFLANTAGGNVSVVFPGGFSYTPGVKQHLTVTISDQTEQNRRYVRSHPLQGVDFR